MPLQRLDSGDSGNLNTSSSAAEERRLLMRAGERWRISFRKQEVQGRGTSIGGRRRTNDDRKVLYNRGHPISAAFMMHALCICRPRLELPLSLSKGIRIWGHGFCDKSKSFDGDLRLRIRQEQGMQGHSSFHDGSPRSDNTRDILISFDGAWNRRILPIEALVRLVRRMYKLLKRAYVFYNGIDKVISRSRDAVTFCWRSPNGNLSFRLQRLFPNLGIISFSVFQPTTN